MMPATKLTEADVARALQVWAEYQKQHDVSDRKGQAVGIDPVGDRVWFGESATEVVRTLHEQRIETPLLFLRVGYNHYVRKGGHR